MPDLNITVETVDVVPFAASPTLAFRLRVANSDPVEKIHTVVLRCQIQIEVARRKYNAVEQEHLRDLFGEPERWGQTLRNLLWVNASVVVPQFAGVATVDLQVPCTFDFSVATTKYFNGLADGEIPVCLMFSGTVFYEGAEGQLLVAPISETFFAPSRLTSTSGFRCAFFLADSPFWIDFVEFHPNASRSQPNIRSQCSSSDSAFAACKHSASSADSLLERGSAAALVSCSDSVPAANVSKQLP